MDHNPYAPPSADDGAQPQPRAPYRPWVLELIGFVIVFGICQSGNSLYHDVHPETVALVGTVSGLFTILIIRVLRTDPALRWPR